MGWGGVRWGGVGWVWVYSAITESRLVLSGKILQNVILVFFKEKERRRLTD